MQLSLRLVQDEVFSLYFLSIECHIGKLQINQSQSRKGILYAVFMWTTQ